MLLLGCQCIITHGAFSCTRILVVPNSNMCEVVIEVETNRLSRPLWIHNKVGNKIIKLVTTGSAANLKSLSDKVFQQLKPMPPYLDCFGEGDFTPESYQLYSLRLFFSTEGCGLERRFVTDFIMNPRPYRLRATNKSPIRPPINHGRLNERVQASGWGEGWP